MSTIADLQARFADRVRDTAARINPLQIEDAIRQALKRYAKAKPLQVAQDYPGDGVTFDLALPTGWVEGFSAIDSVEYPAGERQPMLLERGDYQLYRVPTGVTLRLLRQTPASGKTVRVTFTKPHLVDYSTSTVPVTDEDALIDLAAAIGLRELAASYANTQDPTIAADVVNYRTKAEEYTRLADKLEAAYRTHLGLDRETEAKAASAFVDVDQTSSLGQDKLTHPNRWR